jgi:hypothetical protein
MKLVGNMSRKFGGEHWRLFLRVAIDLWTSFIRYAIRVIRSRLVFSFSFILSRSMVVKA